MKKIKLKEGVTYVHHYWNSIYVHTLSYKVVKGVIVEVRIVENIKIK